MIKTIKIGGIEDLFVVLGADFDHIKQTVSDHSVIIVENKTWNEGISSSIKIGLENIENEFDSVVIFVVDQPFLTKELIQKFIVRYESLKPVMMATKVNNQICHPVLFSKQFYDDLKSLHGDQGGKKLFSHKDVDYFEWLDERLLLDIDTIDDYQKFLQSSDSLSS